MGKGKGNKRTYLKFKKFPNTNTHFLHCQQYDGNIPIFDMESERLVDYFWFEFSIRPTPVSDVYRILIIKFDKYNPYVYLVYPMFPSEQNGTKPVPHRYCYDAQRLCLTFPEYNEWKKGTLPNNYIPWTVLWLYYYEIWLYSGEWKGEGLEPNDPEVIAARGNKEDSEPTLKGNKLSYSPLKKAKKICLERRKINIERRK